MLSLHIQMYAVFSVMYLLHHMKFSLSYPHVCEWAQEGMCLHPNYRVGIVSSWIEFAQWEDGLSLGVIWCNQFWSLRHREQLIILKKYWLKCICKIKKPSWPRNSHKESICKTTYWWIFISNSLQYKGKLKGKHSF